MNKPEPPLAFPICSYSVKTTLEGLKTFGFNEKQTEELADAFVNNSMGMDLRDHFASSIMPGLLVSRQSCSIAAMRQDLDDWTDLSYEIADSMIRARTI